MVLTFYCHNFFVTYQVEINTDYIPRGLEAIYTREKAGKPLETLVPHGKNPDQFMDGLATKFKSVRFLTFLEKEIDQLL